ncbi:glyoxylate/hydroxypyruvate reductase A [Paracoccus pantotrophus]|uniref:Glyoxylate/hydroxypyruvate reductase A n=1 Tax=Paracoccus pantotrophus TaxID=82367 RepID=A0AAE6NRP2_PARPN|nr:glyoxylate/hydroxypyruvate reductase A [Paracoccus pantotrophus]QFG34855.1 glyoxylate/hydroxypyruvate reductase A [Paracoccus pantotrophus]RKS43562.1 glyoxylate/hydroxypyruvate reductase A [Paracoccus pantotrophus]
MALLLHSTPERGAVWGHIFAEAGEGFIPDEASVTDPAQVTHLACWTPPADLSRYPNLRTVICVGAGTDHFPALPEGVALSRTIAPGIEAMVRDWVVMATLALHRDLPFYLDHAARGEWQPRPARLARTRRVGIMGMGRIGRLAAASLQALGFAVSGYSRSGRPVEGVEIFGANRLDAFLAGTDILVCLLPLTDETRGLMGSAFFDRLPQGAGLVHAGRGAQLDMAALRWALDSGRLSAAMLDVTDPEPLPADHWAWRDPRVLITPHIAAHTDAKEGARHALAVIRADRDGQPVPGLVDRSRGY